MDKNELEKIYKENSVWTAKSDIIGHIFKVLDIHKQHSKYAKGDNSFKVYTVFDDTDKKYVVFPQSTKMPELKIGSIYVLKMKKLEKRSSLFFHVEEVKDRLLTNA